MRAARQLRIEGETPEARQTGLQQDRERHRQKREVNPDVPLFEQPAVSSKMRNFTPSCFLWNSTSVLPVSNISLTWLCPLTGLQSVHAVGGTSISLSCIQQPTK